MGPAGLNFRGIEFFPTSVERPFVGPVDGLDGPRFELWLEGTVQLLSDPIAPGSLQYRPCAVLLRRLAANEKEPFTLQAV